ncbi:DUF5691 domain-containing protein [Gordonia sp. HY442]|uniref:DUF5691 domain-containing protein n=1 Tax=Gordonia zhenghanii TaxID=2911516 RepID=UPI001F235D7A|nr:DUF5691 domain-containing protein [Gordonia zhenghanii]MCF8605793.1 DUF5691 domain-containing protein [Gordonia zhenghanii]
MSESIPSPAAVAAWSDELLSAAVLGTDRRPAPTPPPGLGTGDPDLDPAQALLAQASLAAAIDRAGRTAVRATAISAAPAEHQPLAPPRAVQVLRMLIETPPSPPDMRFALVDRWLTTAAAQGVRLPAGQLPVLLALAGTRPELKPALRSAWGERGQWLATLTDTPSSPRPSPQAPPTGVRNGLGERWAAMPARTKEQTLNELRTGLSGADEPFLEGCLDEKSARVRDAARSLLRSLPTSRYSQRMAQRLHSLVTIEHPGVVRRLAALGSNGPLTVRVDPPRELDDAAVRDGLPTLAADADRSSAMRAVVADAPLTTWTTIAGASPAQIIEAVVADTTVRDSLVRAATAQREMEWAAALLEHVRTPDLIAVLEPEQRERFVLARVPKESDVEFGRLLTMAPTPWSPAIANALLDRLDRPMSARNGRTSGIAVATADAVHVPAAVLPRVQSMVDTADNHPGDKGPGDTDPNHERLRAQRTKFLRTAVTFHAYVRSIQEAFT